jgi:hypothetical protein
MQAAAHRAAAIRHRQTSKAYAPPSPPPPKSPGGLHEGIGEGSAAGIEGATGLGAALRFGAALRADFLFADFFGAAFSVFRFLRAGAAFFFFVDFFFALALFAMIDLPILATGSKSVRSPKETSI